MSNYLELAEICMTEDEAASRLIETYGPHHAAAIIQSTSICWFVDRSKWYEMARVVQYGLAIDDFVIDEKAGLAYVGVAQHVALLPTLYWATKHPTFGDFAQLTDRYEIMDQWVIEGRGCFKSKAGPQILMSRDYKLPPELKLLSYRSMDIE